MSRKAGKDFKILDYENYADFFTRQEFSKLSRPLPTDGAPIETAKELTSDLLQKLLQRQIVAIRIPGFCSPKVARRGCAKLLENAKIKNWSLGFGVNRRSTDTNYGLGLPFDMAVKSRAGKKEYIRQAIPALRHLRQAFAPDIGPLDKLRLEVSEIWPGGVRHRELDKQPGLLGQLRVMKAETLFAGKAGINGICHCDSSRWHHGLSANIYLHTPSRGGELRIWDIDLSAKLDRYPLYDLIRQNAFAPNIRDIVQDFLPKPLVIRPKVGDLVIIDTSRPHAVAGFKGGYRINIQSFLSFDPADRSLTLSS